MKNFSARTKENFRRSSNKRTFLVWVVGVCVLLFLAKDAVSSATSFVTTSVFAIRHYMYTSSATVPVFIRSRIELEQHIEELEQEIASQGGLQSALTYATTENGELRELLGATSTPRIVAGVIGRPPFVPYDTLILDRGSDDGIVLHAPVYHGKGIAIGYVRNVTAHSSYVTLFSSPGAESTVYVMGTRLFTTAYGEGGGIVRLSVPQGVVLTPGDAVILPSLDSGVLGTIDSIESVPTEPEQRAYLTIAAPLQSIRLVSVGLRPVEPVSFETALMRTDEAEAARFTFAIPDDERIQEQATSSVDMDGTEGGATSSATSTP